MTAFDVFPRDFSMQLAAENLQLIFQRSAPLKTGILNQVQHDGLWCFCFRVINLQLGTSDL